MKLTVTFCNSIKAPENKMLLPYILDLVWVKTICSVSCGKQHIPRTFCLHVRDDHNSLSRQVTDYGFSTDRDRFLSSPSYPAPTLDLPSNLSST
jgi:hypothetical protein